MIRCILPRWFGARSLREIYAYEALLVEMRSRPHESLEAL
jgi:hypothetical protein